MKEKPLVEEDSKLEDPQLQTIIQFIEEIGILIIEKELKGDCFLPGLELGPNCIFIDRHRCENPGDLLHEAGHIAVTPAEFRTYIGEKDFHKRVGVDSWPTDGDEMATILWSYAAAQYLKIPLAYIFHSNGYKNESDWIIAQFNAGNYIGLPLLQWMEFCDSASFPKMKKWMRS